MHSAAFGLALILLLTVEMGCGRLEKEVPRFSGQSGVNRRLQLWDVAEPDLAMPAMPAAPATRPAESDIPVTGPYRLSTRSIVSLVYQLSPLVTSSRQDMVAAHHGLKEFEANLSRFEPFIRSSGNVSKYPKRRDSTGIAGEVTAGVEKETFDGAVIRVEGGVSGERVRFDEEQEGEPFLEEGSGSLIRGRVEIPFVGSRKRQSRVINAAFQESTARKAVLNYLTDYATYVHQALNYYHYALYYMEYARAYHLKQAQLESLLEDDRVREADRSRIRSSAADARVVVDQYVSSYRSYLLLVLEYIGLAPEDGYVFEEEAGRLSPYLEAARTEEGQERLLAEAYASNPKFRVLTDAIGDAELQRAQAILGEFDVTAFVEGTQFPFGAETYDDRVGGWLVLAGVSVRLNDKRVLGATRLKAEAEIRQYQAQIEAEEMRLRRQIETEAEQLCAYQDSLAQIHENIEQTQAEYEKRMEAYLSRGAEAFTIDDVLASLSAHILAHLRLSSNVLQIRRAESLLMVATGEVYRMVGLSIEENGEGVELVENHREAGADAGP
jgi:hypothetical protein